MGAEFELPTLGAYVKWLRNRLGSTQAQAAASAAIGLSTLRKIEQDKEADYRGDTLDALSNVLCRNDHERTHWSALAGRPTRSTGETTTVDDIGALLARLSPMPAAWLVNWRVAAANDRSRDLLPGSSEAETLPHWLFNDGRAKVVLPDWQHEAEVVTGLLRHFVVATHGRGATADIIGSLMAHPQFARMWESGIVYTTRPRPRRRIWSPSAETMTVLREVAITTSDSSALTIGFPAGAEGLET
ncbi:helix-turn-helix domain-containing protein [Nocardia sp. NBC_01503]|uniref:MmyB family transcriptional regulator n=1 Tax=Nocardia sp. NBC_01503 TaxID=2975997 RepID=UPI002E7C34E9|nr:helix-turn-helix domain-containing protein [Nocardia sp. NBC_01503]WTL35701.1 helix-turn-helix domain-containing protein [Nocardia sp. NBC_01503]